MNSHLISQVGHSNINYAKTFEHDKKHLTNREISIDVVGILHMLYCEFRLPICGAKRVPFSIFDIYGVAYVDDN